MASKAKRVRLDYSQKLKLIDDVEKGMSRVDAAIKYGVKKQTVSDIMKNSKKIGDAINKNAKSNKRPSFPQLDMALKAWFDDRRNTSLPVNGTLIRLKAKQFARELGIVRFEASNGYKNAWLTRHQISLSKTHTSPAKNVNLELAEGWNRTSEGDCSISLIEEIVADCNPTFEDEIEGDEENVSQAQVTNAFQTLRNYYAKQGNDDGLDLLSKLELVLSNQQMSGKRRQLRITDFYQPSSSK